jgi:hypothetical protein
MRRVPTAILAMVLTAAMAATAAAEKTIPVNDPAVPGVFDQPSVAVLGTVIHVAYIGADTTAGPFRVYYAAIDGGTNFTNLSLSRTTTGFLVTPPTTIDNTDAGNDLYADARHPQIALRSSTEAVIFFQAKPVASADPTYALYMARLTLSNKAVVNRSVRRVTGVSGFQEDVSFGLVTTDNTARLAYAGRQGVADPFGVYYARISLENAAVTGNPGTPLLLSSVAGSTGFRPLPSLKLDGLKRAHVAWAANSDSVNPNGVYYSLVKEVNGADNVVIAATEVLGRSRKFGHPNLLVPGNSSIIILAADESLPGTAGNIGLVNINPDADNQDGSPVEVQTNTKFLLTPPGEAILPGDFSVFRPEAFSDSIGTIHVTGYGTNGTRSVYFAFKLASSYPYAQFVTIPVPAGLDSYEFPVSLDGDYTRAAFGFYSGKVVVFWSGEVPGTENRNLDVTGLPTSRAISESQTGCGVAVDPGSAGKRRTADALLILLPSGVLGIRRFFRKALVG